eukprot:3287618-Pleurochrysis_carterae.AAC.6
MARVGLSTGSVLPRCAPAHSVWSHGMEAGKPARRESAESVKTSRQEAPGNQGLRHSSVRAVGVHTP